MPRVPHINRLTPTPPLRPGLLSLLLFLWLAPAAAPAQSDTLVPPSPVATAPLPDSLTTLKDLKRAPRNALLWAAIPGGGQVYNRRWWKVPLVYGGLLGAIAAADFNQTRYTRFVNALEARCLGEGNVAESPFSECQPRFIDFDERIPNSALVQGRNAADRNRQTAYIGIFVVYLLQAVEAYTDAHLQEFDISDDLSFRLGPVTQPDGRLAAGLTVPLGRNRALRRQERRVATLPRRAR